ncbi:serine kinase [Brevundimonas sp. LM2]|uniref:HPr kinase/phosphorylase n=1 Tax=Brevundimonas sp. LM2 TaxID=1938605 RepID=UPI000983A223|nr:HPr kinase/phosphatase C-terminal domain-containing protein [Brevundimonas sp. LM2]AQR60271.1 serine kinase [Brevundimonas sp. LM2]
MTTAPIHATAVATYAQGGWRGALLRGPSGAGKSDLALRLIARGWRLIGDDYVHLWRSHGGLFAAPAQTIAGRIEARGLGILSVTHHPLCRIGLVVDCRGATVDRLPEAGSVTLAGVTLPQLDLDVRPASAVETLAHAIRRL